MRNNGVQDGSTRLFSRIFVFIFMAVFGQGASLVIAAAKVEIQLTVENTLGQTRIQEPVTSGIPLPEKSGVVDENSLALYDSNNLLVPAQFTVLARWGGTPEDRNRPIRWVLLDFQTNVPALGKAVYTLRNQGGNPKPDRAVSIQDTAEELMVDSGALQVTLSKNKNGFINRLTLGNALVVSPGQTTGGLILTDYDGTVYSSAYGAPDSVVVEESGPMRGVVAVKGLMRDAQGRPMPARNILPLDGSRDSGMQPVTVGERGLIAYTLRYHFYGGKNYIRIDSTLTNHGRYVWGEDEANIPESGQWIFMKSLQLRLPFLFANQAAILKTGDGIELSLATGQNARLTQRHDLIDLEDESKNFSFTVSKDGVEAGKGIRSWGWLEFSTGAVGVGVVVRNFWQNYPAEIALSGGNLNVGLLPPGFRYPENNTKNGTDLDKFYRFPDTYQMEGGRQKTWDTLWVFSDQSTSGAAYVAEGFQRPLFARAPADWYAKTEAWKVWGPGDVINPNADVNAALKRYDDFQRTLIDTQYSDAVYKESIFTQREKRAETFAGTADHYGAFHFGDLPWAEGYCNLHYDWTESMFIHYLRLGNPEFLQLANEMLRFRRDWGQKWGNQTSESGNDLWYNFWSRYEKGRHGNLDGWPYGERNAVPSHTWNGGLALGYLLTGDRLALDAAERNGKAAHNWFEAIFDIRNKPADPLDEMQWEIRIQGWSILNLLNLYRITHQEEDFTLAKAIFKNSILQLEKTSGSRGYWGDHGDVSTQNPVMICYITEPLIQLHRETQDAELRDLILRLSDWAMEKVMGGGGTSSDRKYRPWGTPANFGWSASGNSLDELCPVQNSFYADILAYAHFLTGKDAYLQRARNMFHDGILYWQAGDGQLFAPGEISPVNFTSIQYPDTQTKVHGWWSRGPFFYLYYEWIVNEKPSTDVGNWKRF